MFPDMSSRLTDGAIIKHLRLTGRCFFIFVLCYHTMKWPTLTNTEFKMAQSKHILVRSLGYSTEFFLIFLVSASVCNKKLFIIKYGVTRLVFNIDDGNGKKWVKFVAMQQDRSTLIYNFKTMKATVESYLREKAQPYKLQKSHLLLKVSKKQKTVLSRLYYAYFNRLN